MPRIDEGSPDNLGIRYFGAVLTGRACVIQEIDRIGMNSFPTRAQVHEIAPGGIKYAPLSPIPAPEVSYLIKWDPVLLHHLNLDK